MPKSTTGTAGPDLTTQSRRTCRRPGSLRQSPCRVGLVEVGHSTRRRPVVGWASRGPSRRARAWLARCARRTWPSTCRRRALAGPTRPRCRRRAPPRPDLPASTDTITAHSTDTRIGKGSPYSITERRVPELIPVLGSQSAGDVNHKPGGRLPLLSARPAVTPATLKRADTNFAAW